MLQCYFHSLYSIFQNPDLSQALLDPEETAIIINTFTITKWNQMILNYFGSCFDIKAESPVRIINFLSCALQINLQMLATLKLFEICMWTWNFLYVRNVNL